ncbi:MAG: peptide ABC transporter permease [Acidobacteria bacterium RIFCSPLOWO2_02_FULL_67_36]|nr:MAG: peptide ABC transporter permease [Acidobacteria bacterium RIFCSPLOWO2_02_FULL_67_36]OFW25114.1 MAG: peptide ABC transporter permease [Acidobacteria bacterium RIFCSPLOWO2_12_FULL_66_21]
MVRVGLAIVLVTLLAAAAGPALSPFDPADQDLARRLEGPSLSHPLGLDELGRDILARLLVGARISLMVGIAVVGVSSTVGMLFGSIAGYFGGRVDDVISRVIDVLMAFPGILLAIALVAVLGPSLTNVVLALSVIGWVGYARLVRGQALRARELEFVQAARALGAGSRRIVFRHVLPTAFPAVMVQATLGMAGAIIAEASLSFLGLGVQPPTPSWGTMLDAGRSHLFDAPHLTIFPGLAIATLVLGFNFLGDGLRDRVDPKMAR